jgi:hypothetical protein
VVEVVEGEIRESDPYEGIRKDGAGKKGKGEKLAGKGVED